MGRIVQLEAVARRGRYEALEAVQAALSEAGACLIESQFYTDMLAALRLELPGASAETLVSALESRGIALDPASRAALIAHAGDEEIDASLALSFTGATGALRHERPAVPG